MRFLDNSHLEILKNIFNNAQRSLAYILRNTFVYSIKTIYIKFCYNILAHARLHYIYFNQYDGAALLRNGMMVLSFPLGLIGAILYELILQPLYALFGIVIYDRLENMILVWTVLSICGYIQWFIIIPNKVKKYFFNNGQNNS